MAQTEYDWKSWLKTWNDLLIKKLKRSDYQYYDKSIIQRVKSGWLGFDGSSEEQLAELETRLGKRLPPSYRQFLRVSNGFLQPGMLVPRLLNCQEVAWFRDIDNDSMDSWLKWRTEILSTPDTQFDGTRSFLEHIESMVVISEKEESGSARYLLNAAGVSADGEWEAYYYAHWKPGADRYESFWHLMQNELDFLTNWKD